MKNFLAALCFLLAAFAPATAQDSDERIRSFDSRITVNTDGSMLVKETIAITCAGEIDPARHLSQLPDELQRLEGELLFGAV
jgi:hypothetical protein